MRKTVAYCCPQQSRAVHRFQRPVYVGDFASKRSGLRPKKGFGPQAGSFASLRMTGFLPLGSAGYEPLVRNAG